MKDVVTLLLICRTFITSFLTTKLANKKLVFKKIIGTKIQGDQGSNKSCPISPCLGSSKKILDEIRCYSLKY